jgi:hypothetical protein
LERFAYARPKNTKLTWTESFLLKVDLDLSKFWH